MVAVSCGGMMTCQRGIPASYPGTSGIDSSIIPELLVVSKKGIDFPIMSSHSKHIPDVKNAIFIL